jgi:multicomponent Na+:H+ antiporter subunit E
VSYLPAVLVLTLVYVGFTNNLELSNIVVGLLIAAGISGLLRLRVQQLNWRRLPSAAWAMTRYAVLLIYDLMVSGVRTARIVLDPNLPIKPGIVAIPSERESDLAMSLNAHAISLTPGELVVEMDEEGVMYTHCLDASSAEKVIEAQKARQKLLDEIIS